MKTLYGLKQSGREWNKELDEKLQNFGFQSLRSDPCAYVRRNGEHLEIITVWVDDLLLFATSDELMEKMKSEIRSEWEVTDLGEPAKIVGIEITKSDKSITISQGKYIENILKREGMDDANPVSMPMDPNIKIKPNPDGNEGSRSNYYAKLLGELQFLTNSTRPDIAYAINKLAAYTANPSLQHVGALKRLLRYLKGTKNLGIMYSAPQNELQNTNIFHGYSDAAYADTDDYKSTSGYVFIVGEGAVTWRSKKQSTIALSSTEAEYIALSEAGREACWLRNLYSELGYTQKFPNLIKGDNDGSIAMARNPQFHKRAKHIATQWHWIRDLVQKEIITIESCRDPEQTADVLTKPLARPKHQKHLREMGLVTI
jgi:Reverse transcriptase (RNA-dependent DNA polymerase)